MSAGKFVSSFYQTDGGAIARIRVQPETISTGNPAATGPATLPISARVSNGNRQIGIKPRSISIKFTGTPPSGYSEGDVLRIPIMTQATYNGLNLGGTFSYLGGSAEIVGKNPERVR